VRGKGLSHLTFTCSCSYLFSARAADAGATEGGIHVCIPTPRSEPRTPAEAGQGALPRSPSQRSGSRRGIRRAQSETPPYALGCTASRGSPLRLQVWPELKAHVDAQVGAEVLERARQAFCDDDAPAVRRLLEQYPSLKAIINASAESMHGPLITDVQSVEMLDALLDA